MATSAIWLGGIIFRPRTRSRPTPGKYVMCLKRQRDGSWKLDRRHLEPERRRGRGRRRHRSGAIDHVAATASGRRERGLDLGRGGPVARLEQQPPPLVVGMDLGGRPVVPEHGPVVVGPLEDACRSGSGRWCSPAPPASAPTSRFDSPPSNTPRSDRSWPGREGAEAGGRRGSMRTASRRWLTWYSGAVRASSTSGCGPARILPPAGQLGPVDPLDVGKLVGGDPPDASKPTPRPGDQDDRRADQDRHHHDHQERTEPGPAAPGSARPVPPRRPPSSSRHRIHRAPPASAI